MARPKNPTGMEPISFKVVPRMWGWLEELADYAVYGTTATAVAQRFVQDGVRRELREGGLLHTPPRNPRRKRT